MPSNGILAGDMQANDLARCALYGILADTHCIVPRAGPSCFVDDLTQQCEDADEDRVAEDLATSASVLIPALVRDKHRPSRTKSIVVATMIKVARRIARILKTLGIQVEPAQRSRDLGIGCAGGRKRAAQVMTKRLKGVIPRMGRVRAMARVVPI